MSASVSIVITSVNSPKTSMHERAFSGWRDVAQRLGGQLIVVGDRKTPHDEYRALPSNDFEYLSPDRQDELYPDLSSMIGWDTYCRKELGYLRAFQNGADFVFETDDDNFPLDVGRAVTAIASASVAGPGDYPITARAPLDAAHNYYGAVEGDNDRWARGLPFWHRDNVALLEPREVAVPIPVVCWMPAQEPDYCALCRIYQNQKRLHRNTVGPGPAVLVGTVPHQPLKLSVFNSQATLWSRAALPQMLLALSCHQRAADLIRSYVVQTYHPVLLLDGIDWVAQERNPHHILNDYADEFSAAAGFDKFLRTKNVFEAFDVQPHIAHAHNVEWLKLVSAILNRSN